MCYILEIPSVKDTGIYRDWDVQGILEAMCIKGSSTWVNHHPKRGKNVLSKMIKYFCSYVMGEDTSLSDYPDLVVYKKTFFKL